MDNLEAWSVILGGLFSLVGVILTIRSQRAASKVDNAQKTYDQLQEDYAATRKDVAGLRQTIDHLTAMVRIQDDYIAQLRQLIQDKLDQAPPPYPLELAKRLLGGSND